MELINHYPEIWYVENTGFDRQTVKRRLERIPFISGGVGNAKLRDSKVALPALYLGAPSEFTDCDDEDSGISAQEANRRLTIARKKQIELQNEVIRKERWTKEDVEEIHDHTLTNAAAIIKAHEGKVLDATLIQDIFTELRGMGAKLTQL